MTAILTAASVLISERGVTGVTLRDIAEKANVNHGLIIRHFGSKEKLVKDVGLYVVRSMFEDAKARGVELLDILMGRGERYSMNIRAAVRIIMDDPNQSMIVDARPLINGVQDWVKEQQERQRINSATDPLILLFIFACLIVGDELFGPYVRKIMKIPADAYKRLRPQIFQTVISGLHEVPYEASQTGAEGPGIQRNRKT